MQSKIGSIITMVLMAAMLFAGCAPTGSPSTEAPVVAADAAGPVVTEAAASATAGDAGSPGEVARLFFEAYTETVRNHQQALGSPDFAEQKYLSQDYLRQVEEIQAGFEGGGFDPILQVQNPPPGPIEVNTAQVKGIQATVVLQFGRGVLEQPWERVVSLEQIDGEWKIVPDQLEEAAQTAEETVQAFYAWYLNYIGSGAQMRNPLSDQAYRSAPYLDPEFIQRVDRMGENGFDYDPFLCAQDVPETMRVVSSFENAAHPTVVVESSFTGHFLVVDLIRSNFNQWKIRNITCGRSPTGTAKAFYTWALGYMVQPDGMRNPWLEGAYRRSPYLSAAFIEKLDATVTSGEPLPADPVLLAQDVPQSFNVDACAEPNCALVNLQYGDAVIHQLRVEMEVENGTPRIAAIQHAQELENPLPLEPLPGVGKWAPFRDEQYGYALRYPADWRPVGLKVTQMTEAGNYPVLRSIYFEPPVSIGPFYPIRLDVFTGTQAQLIEMYDLGEALEQKNVNGTPAAVYNSDLGMIYYVFRHPSQETTWFIFTDLVTQFPGREAAAQQIEGVFEAMMTTVVFAR